MRYQEAVRSESITHRPIPSCAGLDEAPLRITPTDFAWQRPTSAPASPWRNVREAPPGSLAPHHLQQATDLLLANLNGPMGIIEIARACHLTRSHFSRAFKLSTGISPVEWRLNARLEKAKALLSTSLTLTEVGLEAGFCDQAHFTKAFTRLAGTTPKRWRAAWAVESAGTTLKR